MAAYKLQKLDDLVSPIPAHRSLRLAMIAAERECVIAMRDRNEISDAVMNRLQGEFDHEQVLLQQRYH